MSTLDFSKDMQIQADRLDIEWLEQPELMYTYLEHEAQCKRRVQEAFDNKKALKAQLEQRAAQGGEALIGAKPTVANTEAWAKSQPEYRKADQDLSDAQYALDKATAACQALRAKKDALENLVKLVNIQYFAPPREQADLSGYVPGLRRDRVAHALRQGINKGKAADVAEAAPQKDTTAEAAPRRRSRRGAEEQKPAETEQTPAEQKPWIEDMPTPPAEDLKFVPQEEFDAAKAAGPDLRKRLRTRKD